MGSSILPVKLLVTIDTMLNFDRDCDSDGDDVRTCKRALRLLTLENSDVNILFHQKLLA